MPRLLGPLSPLSHVEPKVWTELIAVNVTANWQLIRCMEPLLQKSDAGRAVLITSGAASSGQAYWGPYATSKAALDAMARSWAAENATKNLKINLFSPGAVRTRMRATAFPGEDRDTLTPPEAVAEKIVELCLPGVTRDRAALFIPGREIPAIQQAVVTAHSEDASHASVLRNRHPESCVSQLRRLRCYRAPPE